MFWYMMRNDNFWLVYNWYIASWYTYNNLFLLLCTLSLKFRDALIKLPHIINWTQSALEACTNSGEYYSDSITRLMWTNLKPSSEESIDWRNRYCLMWYSSDQLLDHKVKIQVILPAHHQFQPHFWRKFEIIFNKGRIVFNGKMIEIVANIRIITALNAFSFQSHFLRTTMTNLWIHGIFITVGNKSSLSLCFFVLLCTVFHKSFLFLVWEFTKIWIIWNNITWISGTIKFLKNLFTWPQFKFIILVIIIIW